MRPDPKLTTLQFGELSRPVHDVVYLHGLPGSALEGWMLDEAARKLKIRITSFDRPGFGASNDPRLNTYSFTELGDLYLKTLQQQRIGDRNGSFSIVAVSGGCPHALSLAAAAGNLVKKTVIISGIGPLERRQLHQGMPQFNQIILRLARHRISAWVAIPFVATIARGWRTRPEALITYMARILPGEDRTILRDPTFAEPFARSMQRGVSAEWQDGWRGPYSELRRITSPWNIATQSIQSPVTIFHGDQDKYVPIQNGRATAALVPHAQLHVVSGRGHFMAARFADRLFSELDLE